MPDKTIASIDNAINIIDLAISKDGITQTDVRNEFGWSKTNVHYYLKTLQKHGLVTKKEDQYYPGLGFASYGRAALNQIEVAQPLANVVDNLANETGKMALLAVEQNNQIYYVHQRKGDDSRLERGYVGKARDLHTTAFGKVILAFMEDESRDDLLDSIELYEYTENTITTRDELCDDLEEVRENDLAYSNGEFDSSLRSIASPIRDRSGEHLLGALGVVGLKETMESPNSDTKAQRFAQTDANIVKQLSKMARNKIEWEKHG